MNLKYLKIRDAYDIIRLPTKENAKEKQSILNSSKEAPIGTREQRRRSTLRDQRPGIPQPNVAINKPTGDEAERKLLGIRKSLPPRQAVEALGAGNRAGQDELLII
nr:hypothetical protein Iba_chr04cCG13540 [Ipomoea batatas]GMC89146.1 hypothetical protein Iba_chr04eCG16740 [Ipomoea batatas]GMD33290.1 hypothetical protein Iba_scaffold44015CG0020 [Ipomoea batatas]